MHIVLKNILLPPLLLAVCRKDCIVYTGTVLKLKWKRLFIVYRDILGFPLGPQAVFFNVFFSAMELEVCYK